MNFREKLLFNTDFISKDELVLILQEEDIQEGMLACPAQALEQDLTILREGVEQVMEALEETALGQEALIMVIYGRLLNKVQEAEGHPIPLMTLEEMEGAQ